MSTYTVPQDVEADDKLLGPFTFRQFVYLIIVAFACLGGWLLSQIFIGLIIIPLPIVLIFGALALPLKKDQPMETYLAAIISFRIKPKNRYWRADGKDRSITIEAPKVVEVDRTKGVSGTEALQRLSYLSNLTDSGGWAIKGAVAGSSVNEDIYREAMDVSDILDDSSQTSAMIEERLTANEQKARQQAMSIMQHPETATATAQSDDLGIVLPPREQPVQMPPTVQHFTPPTGQIAPQGAAGVGDAPLTNVKFNPYPEFHQAVIQPLSANQPNPAQAPAATAVPAPAQSQASKPEASPDILGAASAGEQASLNPAKRESYISPDIINLANNTDLTVETIAREAKRLEQKKQKDSGEVFVSLH
ncbi:MAG: PrgI family protein [Candidatus Nomurabacteria bacterium]|jgi:hypothetical protein|nr:PrgI family protein [Candidatus Nomurabacteria bacterium]